MVFAYSTDAVVSSQFGGQFGSRMLCVCVAGLPAYQVCSVCYVLDINCQLGSFAEQRVAVLQSV
jgi:hypothetical protein